MILLITFLINDATPYQKRHDQLSTLFGIHGKFIPAVPMDESSQQRNILPKIEGEEGDPQLSFGSEEPKPTADLNNEQHKNSAEVKDLIGDVLHFDENMINHHKFQAAARHLSEPSSSEHHEHEDGEMENEPVTDDEPSQEDEGVEEDGDGEKQKETVENNENTNLEKDEYTSKGREENMHFNKLMNQLELDPELGSPSSSSFPTNQMVNNEYKEYKSPQKPHVGLPIPAGAGGGGSGNKNLESSKKASCPHPRCDIDGSMNSFEGHFEPPGDEEVPYEGMYKQQCKP